MGRLTSRRRVAHLSAVGAETVVAGRVETVVVEEPLEIRINGSPVTVTMRTPGSDFELARGFLLTEGVIHDRADVATVRYCRGAEQDGVNTYNTLDVTLQPGMQMPDVDVTRNFYTTSSCGVCGKASLEAVWLSSRHSPGDDPTVVSAATLTGLPDTLRAAQKVFARTGGLHGAALFDPDGTMLAVREDVGRHNAVDKVIGFLLESGQLPLADVLTVSGRVSFEIVQKCARAGIPVLSAISAPSSLAVEMSERWGITLAGFCRDDRASFYSRLDRVVAVHRS